MIKNLTTNVLILIYILIFFIPPYSTSLFVGLILCIVKSRQQKVMFSGSLARLDTFGVIFRFFSPYLFFQPTASSFFCIPRSRDYLLLLFDLGTNKTKKQIITRGGSRGKAWHIWDKIINVTEQCQFIT